MSFLHLLSRRLTKHPVVAHGGGIALLLALIVASLAAIRHTALANVREPHNVPTTLERMRDAGQTHNKDDAVYKRCLAQVKPAARGVCCVRGATIRSLQSPACQKALEDQVDETRREDAQEPPQQDEQGAGQPELPQELRELPPGIQREMEQLRQEIQELEQLKATAKAIYDQGLACEQSCPCGIYGTDCPPESIPAHNACIQRCDVVVPELQALIKKGTALEAQLKRKGAALEKKIAALQKKKAGRKFRAIEGATH